MADYTGPLPVPSPESKPFWDGLRRHQLLLPFCRPCGAFFYYPRAACPRCLSADLEWKPVSGRGTLHTFTVVSRGQKGFPLGPPYVIAIVELEEGPRMMTNLVGIAADPAVVRIGMPVEVTFLDATSGCTLPHFKPAGGGA
jgi:uncharacterized OB-fold protein